MAEVISWLFVSEIRPVAQQRHVMERAQSFGYRALAKGAFARELPLALGNL